MSIKMPIVQFVTELVAAFERGDGYIMGSYGQNPRTGYLDLSVPESKCKSAWKPTGYYYEQYADSKAKHAFALKWRKQCTRVWDCNGLAEGIYELFSGVCINSKARHNYAEWCDPKGEGMIPVERRVPGAAVFWSDSKASKIHHVAYLWQPVKDGHPEGDWYIIEAKGYTANRGGLYEAEDSISATFRFDSGLVGSGSWCFVAHESAREDRIEVIGDQGMLCFSVFTYQPIELNDHTGHHEFSIPNPEHVQQPLIENIVHHLQKRDICTCNGISATPTNWVMDRILGKI